MSEEQVMQPEPVCGLLLVDKPADRRITSMTVIRSVRRRLITGGEAAFGPQGGTSRNIKVGHAGTLDPLASGLLIVMVGKATRLCEAYMAKSKTYTATVDLSRWSPTDDLEVPTHPNTLTQVPDRAAVEACVQGFVGEIQQRPPAHSAVWIEGERAYDMAREGRAPEMKARTIRIDRIAMTDYQFPLVSIEVECGKGTYIRSLARDIGMAITGAPGCLVALRRTRIEPFGVDEAVPLDHLPLAMTREHLRFIEIPKR